MALYKNISSKVIIRKIMRDLKLSTDNWIDDAIEWMGEALEHIGAVPQLEKKVCTLAVTDYTTCLPSDLYYINLVGINNVINVSLSSVSIYWKYILNSEPGSGYILSLLFTNSKE